MSFPLLPWFDHNISLIHDSTQCCHEVFSRRGSDLDFSMSCNLAQRHQSSLLFQPSRIFSMLPVLQFNPKVFGKKYLFVFLHCLCSNENLLLFYLLFYFNLLTSLSVSPVSFRVSEWVIPFSTVDNMNPLWPTGPVSNRNPLCSVKIDFNQDTGAHHLTLSKSATHCPIAYG